MITGDSIFTGISIAKKCEIVKPSLKVYVAEIEYNNQLVLKNYENVWDQFKLNSSEIVPNISEKKSLLKENHINQTLLSNTSCL